MNLLQYRNKTVSLKANLIPWIEEILVANAEYIKDLLRDQMYAGLDGKGQLLKPGYSQDPYFKKPGAGERYAKWKDRLMQRDHNSIFPVKPIDTPNLIVTGTQIYDRLIFKVGNEKFVLDANSSIIADIKRKYGDIFALSPLAIRFFIQKILRPRLTLKINNHYAQ